MKCLSSLQAKKGHGAEGLRRKKALQTPSRYKLAVESRSSGEIPRILSGESCDLSHLDVNGE